MVVSGKAHQMLPVTSVLRVLVLPLRAGCKPPERGFVSGQIVDEFGTPIKGTLIVVGDLGADNGVNDNQLYSGTNGGFFVAFRCDHAGLSVYAEGCASLYCTQKIVRGANRDWTIKLASISGTVLDTEGHPVPD